MGAVSADVEVLVGSRRRQLRLLIIGLFLVGASVGAALSGSVFGWFGVLFFGFGLLLAVESMIWPARLELSPEGFRSVQFGWKRSDLYEWRLCRDFQLFHPTAGQSRWSSERLTLVAYNYDSPRRAAVKKLSRGLAGVECALPDTYSMTAGELRDLLLSRQWQALHQ